MCLVIFKRDWSLKFYALSIFYSCGFLTTFKYKITLGEFPVITCRNNNHLNSAVPLPVRPPDDALRLTSGPLVKNSSQATVIKEALAALLKLQTRAIRTLYMMEFGCSISCGIVFGQQRKEGERSDECWRKRKTLLEAERVRTCVFCRSFHKPFPPFSLSPPSLSSIHNVSLFPLCHPVGL